MDVHAVALDLPSDANLIAGQAHFIKTVEDLAEIVVTSVPGATFGIAFCEASGPCLIRTEGNDPELIEAAVSNAERVASGHVFFLLLRGAYPINLLNAVKGCPEVCQVFCATANPVQALVAQSDQGRGVIGVIDGASPRGREQDAARTARREFLRNIGYKR
ncbi:MAG: adenosine-specific kinase [Candidatus Eisenbacteria bacterium]|uniref:Adenosine-specific kinase n=1 Tax=Eiseniibacteriota bacterium TaxID=2212470 RepID=A0A9D6L8P0_UNCEI|nr:adenosine-specific kinase [Candidatus Eisenbacteria bacterium]MBI3539914.1 adenosine-specific kinase [Candidatus Eisenbacteria bacterium]